MPSPFPGMDPYLEQSWGDVHHRLITYATDQLQPTLPGDLRARIEELLTEVHPTGASFNESPPEAFIQIIDVASGRRVVTVIEILSPLSKVTGEPRHRYRARQKQLLTAGVNLVEIDLLRSGHWVLALPQDCVPEEILRCKPFRIVVRRAHKPQVELYAAALQERLPRIALPLREKDLDVQLDVQAIVDRCYENGGYEDTDYSRDPDPPLARCDAVWADELLRRLGKRPEKGTT
jgi:hypothetical protein